jgi:hypothetical protein
MKTAALSSHRFLSNSRVEKNEHLNNIDSNFDHQMSLSKSKVFKQLFKFSKVCCSIKTAYCIVVGIIFANVEARGSFTFAKITKELNFKILLGVC